MISVIIPVYNDEKNLLDCIKSLLVQDTKDKYEIIVVEDGSKSNLKKLLKKYKLVKYYCKKNGGPASARNFGIKEAKGDIICFIDSDAIANKDWLFNITKKISEKGVGGIGGKTINRNEGILSESLHLIEFGGFTKRISRETRVVPTVNACYYKKDILSIGGFDESYFYGEDTDLNWKITKLNKKIMYEPSAIVSHKTPNSIKNFKKMYFMGKGFYETRIKNNDLSYVGLAKNTFLLIAAFFLLPFVSCIRIIMNNEIGFWNSIKLFPLTTLLYFPYWLGVLFGRWKK